jgi:hypothetical protein
MGMTVIQVVVISNLSSQFQWMNRNISRVVVDAFHCPGHVKFHDVEPSTRDAMLRKLDEGNASLCKLEEEKKERSEIPNQSQGILNPTTPLPSS